MVTTYDPQFSGSPDYTGTILPKYSHKKAGEKYYAYIVVLLWAWLQVPAHVVSRVKWRGS